MTILCGLVFGALCASAAGAGAWPGAKGGKGSNPPVSIKTVPNAARRISHTPIARRAYPGTPLVWRVPDSPCDPSEIYRLSARGHPVGRREARESARARAPHCA